MAALRASSLMLLAWLAGAAAVAAQGAGQGTAPGAAEAATPGPETRPAVAAPAAVPQPAPAAPATPGPAAAEPAPAGPRAAAATVVQAVLGEVEAEVPVSGTLVARQEVQVFPQVSGFEIVEIAVDAGDRVEKGQLLARLSDATLKAQLAQAEAERQRAEAGLSQARSQVASAAAALNQAAAALERAQRLRASGSGTQAALDQAIAAEASARAAEASTADGIAVAEAQVAQAAAARDIARLNVERTRITAPVAGVISARNAELGALAGAAQAPLFTLVAEGRIEVAGEIIETALDEVAVGDPAVLRVAGVGEVAGEVRLVPAAVDAVTRLGIVRIALEDEPGLRTGLFASGAITTERRQAVTVPTTAVSSAPEGDSVQVVVDGRVELRPVEPGLIWHGRREIVAGLDAGETVIARAAAFFRDGDPVEAVPAEEAAATAARQQRDAAAAEAQQAQAAASAEAPAAAEAAPAAAPSAAAPAAKPGAETQP